MDDQADELHPGHGEHLRSTTDRAFMSDVATMGRVLGIGAT